MGHGSAARQAPACSSACREDEMVPSELLERHRSQGTADNIARTTAAMPLLKSGVEHAALRPGKNTLGWRGPDALPIAGLAFQPPLATIILPEQGPAVIQRITAAVVVRLNDVPMGVAAVELRNGATIDVSGTRLIYDAFGTGEHAPVAVSGDYASSSGE